ncbi:hypothetical protein FH972_027142 [Carpinus fangiana]|uniref:Sodium/calcium exchanger membrane region domain-containing protein n=1 Tax=Carpinus fangiana TaxID=176857 RepID=A0A5N6L639_9ROSI|nr:hypothetical protein FH972_027142 [Carpinus fangiana]
MCPRSAKSESHEPKESLSLNQKRASLPLSMSSHLNLFFLLVLLILCSPTNGRQSSYDVVSDGGVHQVHASPYLALNRPSAADSSCDQAYGFLPCSTSVLGNLFLILAYGYLMYLAATYLSSGSELLLEILGPGIVGGLILPILGAAPDSMIILGTHAPSFHYLQRFLLLFLSVWLLRNFVLTTCMKKSVILLNSFMHVTLL